MTVTDPVATIGKIGKHWGWYLTFGILTVALGISAVVWPAITLLAAAIVFGVQLIFAGIYRLVSAFASEDASGATRVLYALLGILSLVVGLYAVRHVLLTIVALALLLGIFWIVNGVIEIFTAAQHQEMHGRGWRVFMGILSTIAGVILLAIPGISLLALVVVVSVWLIMFGLLEISLALRGRSGRAALSGRAGR
jgi:uncharacterized membrane protein HdeD (DUF308 family)